MNEQNEFDERVVRYFSNGMTEREKTDFQERLDEGKDRKLMDDYQTYTVLYGVAKRIRRDSDPSIQDDPEIHDADLLERERRSELTERDRRELLDRKDDAELEELRQTYLLLESLDEPTEQERALVTAVVGKEQEARSVPDEEAPQGPARVRSLLNRRFLPVLSMAAGVLLLIVATFWIVGQEATEEDEKAFLEKERKAIFEAPSYGYDGRENPDTARILADADNYSAAYDLLPDAPVPGERTGEKWDGYVILKGRILLGLDRPQEAAEWLLDHEPTVTESGKSIKHKHLLVLALLADGKRVGEALRILNELEEDPAFRFYQKEESLKRIRGYIENKEK